MCAFLILEHNIKYLFFFQSQFVLLGSVLIWSVIWKQNDPKQTRPYADFSFIFFSFKKCFPNTHSKFEINSYSKYVLTSVLSTLFWIHWEKRKEKVHARIWQAVHKTHSLIMWAMDIQIYIEIRHIWLHSKSFCTRFRSLSLLDFCHLMLCVCQLVCVFFSSVCFFLLPN